ncbi:hypothetical protein CAPTEDRAFT_174182 [Capitella teleta]|uniref:C2H2-type domain-containing protein n=1 Tax=Capitella teleta TaxID=283909 RepID=R7V521_CAPTE|nr:hypothetical protein CAPTEDRAFT_174182 [Capitella teleta]|eukprot:ELU13958.1 hypothetical protein CAPTEDRAFT_174182 [Capitella teleta]
MSAFTCINCRVSFADADLQRSHYKSDWHRYNLKRKVADLPPVTAENFQTRVLAQKAQVAEQAVPTTVKCAACSKQFSSQNAHANHLNSKKHKELAAKYEESEAAEQDMQVDAQQVVEDKNAKNQAIKEGLLGQSEPQPEASGSQAAASSSMQEDEDMGSDTESWDGDALGLEECLFCSFISRTLEKNVNHMTREHSFFIPDIEFLTDLEGLIVYLGQKVGEGHICLWCNEKGKTFYSTQAVQKHMIDKGHCMMLHDGDVLLEYADFYDYRSSYPDEERPDKGGEEDADPVELNDEGFQLVLPSGNSIGHRSLQRYYRQKLRPERAVVVRNPTALSRVMAGYKALGWTGGTGPMTKVRANDLQYMKRVQWKSHMRLGVKANKLQHHYREQNPI